MTTEDYEIQCVGRGARQGDPQDSRRPLRSWSSYLAPGPIQFRTPSYTTDTCQAPRLRQGNFGDGSAPDVEEQVQPGDQQGTLACLHDRILSDSDLL